MDATATPCALHRSQPAGGCPLSPVQGQCKVGLGYLSQPHHRLSWCCRLPSWSCCRLPSWSCCPWGCHDDWMSLLAHCTRCPCQMQTPWGQASHPQAAAIAQRLDWVQSRPAGCQNRQGSRPQQHCCLSRCFPTQNLHGSVSFSCARFCCYIAAAGGTHLSPQPQRQPPLQPSIAPGQTHDLQARLVSQHTKCQQGPEPATWHQMSTCSGWIFTSPRVTAAWIMSFCRHRKGTMMR